MANNQWAMTLKENNPSVKTPRPITPAPNTHAHAQTLFIQYSFYHYSFYLNSISFITPASIYAILFFFTPASIYIELFSLIQLPLNKESFINPASVYTVLISSLQFLFIHYSLLSSNFYLYSIHFINTAST